jgi:hypothetical protein
MSDVRIVVVQRGWVFVGEYEHGPNGVVLRRAKNIRRWGTSKGLGELAEGPRLGTTLDDAGLVRMHPMQVLFTIDANPEKWERHLG